MRSVVRAAGIPLLSWAAIAQVVLGILTPPNLPAGFTGASYSNTLTAGSDCIGSPPVTWSLTAGALPAGLVLSPAGVIAGVPTTAGTWIFGVRLKTGFCDGSKMFTLTILPGPPRLVITAAPLPSGYAGDSYEQNLAAGGGVPPYAWALTSGAMPAGLGLTVLGPTGEVPTATIWIQGVIQEAAVTSTFTVTVTDGSSATATQTFTIAITPLTVTTSRTLPTGAAGASYSQILAATGGAPPYSWSLTLGALPPGLSLSSAGVLSGTPITAGTAAFIATVTDANSATASRSFTLAITPFAITTASPLPAGVNGVPYSQTFAVNGGSPPYNWAIASGALPAGLALSGAGVLSGTPTAYGTSNFTVLVTDANGFTASLTFTLTISPAPLLISAASPLPSGVAGTAYSQTLTATGGVAPYQWQISSGSLPPLLTLSSAGVISGVPATPGASSFTVSVIDNSLHTTSQTFSLTITLGPLSISTPATLPPGLVGTAYSQTFAATGGVPPYTWQVKAGTWPPGLIFSSGGALSGSPTQAGAFSFTLQVTDSSGATASTPFTLLISAATCASSLGNSGAAFTAAGGSGTVSVNAPASCQWTASSALNWVAITSGASGTGNGPVAYQVAANSGAARSGSIVIAGFPFTVEQAAASSAGLTTIGSLAHVTSGGYWKDTITLVNNGTSAEEVAVSFYDDSGNPLALPVNFPQSPLSAPLLANTIHRTLNAGAQLLIETVGPDDQPSQGGWARVQASGSLTGQSVFRWGAPPRQQEATAQLETRAPAAFLLAFDQTGGYVLGVAVANATAAAVNIPATLTDDSGALLAATTISLPALGHASFMLTDQFPAAAQKRGTLTLTVPSGAQISTLAFRANSQGSLASVLPLVK